MKVCKYASQNGSEIKIITRYIKIEESCIWRIGQKEVPIKAKGMKSGIIITYEFKIFKGKDKKCIVILSVKHSKMSQLIYLKIPKSHKMVCEFEILNSFIQK